MTTPLVALKHRKVGQNYYPRQLGGELKRAVTESDISSTKLDQPTIILPDGVKEFYKLLGEDSYGFMDVLFHGNTVHPLMEAGLSSPLRPGQKPVHLMEMLVLLFTQPGDLIVDLTAGTGSTGVAAIKWGRKFLGIDKDPGVVSAMKLRLEKAEKAIQSKNFSSEDLK
jgi:DNA modification methylase